MEIFKKEWPNSWTSFVKDLVNAAMESESSCQNSMYILKIVVEDVFQFNNTMTSDFSEKIRESLQSDMVDIFNVPLLLASPAALHASAGEHGGGAAAPGHPGHHPPNSPLPPRGLRLQLPADRRPSQIPLPGRLPHERDALSAGDPDAPRQRALPRAGPAVAAPLPGLSGRSFVAASPSRAFWTPRATWRRCIPSCPRRSWTFSTHWRSSSPAWRSSTRSCCRASGRCTCVSPPTCSVSRVRPTASC